MARESEPSPDSLGVVLEVVDALEALEIPYHLGGSFASSLHGNARQTRDADFVVQLRSAAQVHLLAARLGSGFYLDPSALLRAVRQRSSCNLVHLGSAFKIDLFVQGDSEFDRAELRRSVPQTLAGLPERSIQVKSPEDTILRKLQWFDLGGRQSERQWSDVLGVLKVQRPDLDFDYLRRTATELGIHDLLQEALGP
ncbi:MAG: hypothetical protein AAGN66_13045 [Acidobacteriota bacterium]